MRVLLISDIAHTGFGRVGRELAQGLIGRGHDVRVLAINYRGVQGELTDMARNMGGKLSDRIVVSATKLAEDPLIDVMYPAGEQGHALGHNLTAPAIDGGLWPTWKPEGIILVADPWAVMGRLSEDHGAIGRAKAAGVRIYNYVPIEGAHLSPSLRPMWETAEPVAMSTFGQAEIAKVTGKPVPLAYHGVSEVFRPVTPDDPATYNGETYRSRDSLRDALGYRGKTVILRTDRYVFRKNYPAWFRVVEPVLDKHPDVLAIAHTVLMDEFGQGDLRQLIAHMGRATYHSGLEWRHPQVLLTRQHNSYRGLTDEELRLLYVCADVYLTTTMAEGFGLCLAEALACGTPVVANDYSAIAEVVGPGGLLVPPAATFTNAYAHEWSLADEPAMTAALERLVTKPALRRQLGAEGRRHVARFTWKAAVDVFDGLLTPAAVAA